MRATLSNGDRLDSEDRSLWHALVILGMIPPSEMFSRITRNSVVEIYDTQGIQVWRNFNFLEICSYTLEEMHCLEWYNRYERDPKKTEEILSAVNDLFAGKVPEVHFAAIADHLLEEKSSVERLRLRAKHDWFVLLKDKTGQPSGFVVFSEVRVAGRSSSIVKSKPNLVLLPTDPSRAISDCEALQTQHPAQNHARAPVVNPEIEALMKRLRDWQDRNVSEVRSQCPSVIEKESIMTLSLL